MHNKNRKRATTALLVAVLIWSSTYISTKQALGQVPPATLACMRFMLASLVLFPFFLNDPSRKQRVPWGVLALLGFTGAFLYFGLQNWGLYYTSVSAGSLIQGGIPVIIALLSAIFLGERIDTSRVIGILLSITGVAGIVFMSGEIQVGGQCILGKLLMLGSSLAWGAYTILNKRYNLTVSPITATLATSFYGLLFMLPFGVIEMHIYDFRLSWLTTFNVLFLGIVAMGLPILLWNYALLHYDASEAGLFLNLVPVFSVIGAMVFLGERVNVGQLLAGGFVILGVIVTSGFRMKGRTSYQ